MAAQFGDILQENITKRGWSVNRFAKSAKCAQGHVSAVIAGKKRPSSQMARRWADALALNGSERSYFLRLAALCHVPDDMRADLAELVEEDRKSG